jgi:molecular chaperone IbpA
MRNMLDFSPYRRSLIGFDHLFDLMESAVRMDGADRYPPYDVEQRSEDGYRIRLAVAGFTPGEIDVSTREGVLTVSGRKEEKAGDSKYLYRGISADSFERCFQLADYVEVTGATLADGVLEIDLKREVPEAVKPKKITIGQPSPQKRLTKEKSPEAA